MQMEFLVVKASANILCTNCQNWGSRQLLIPFCMKLCSTQAPCIGFPRQYSCATRVVQACSMEPRKSTDISNRTMDLWHTAGATLAGVLLEGSMLEDAYAAESISNETVNVASRAPQWLAPAVIAFPVFSYALFNIYRDKVNPRAKVSDWMFGLAAMVIVANLVTIVTLGDHLTERSKVFQRREIKFCLNKQENTNLQRREFVASTTNFSHFSSNFWAIF